MVGIFEDGKRVVGEDNITHTFGKIKSLEYDKKVSISSDVKKEIDSADLILFSAGSLYTSITPNLLVDGVCNTINESKARKMYICNLVTQPGETDGYKVSDHIKYLERYLGTGSIDAVIANDKKISSYYAKKYSSLEQKDPVLLDEQNVKRMNVEVIKDALWKVEDSLLRHDSLKVAYLIFSYLMDNEI